MSDGISPDVSGDIFAPQGSVYSPQGQDRLANDLAFGTTDAPEDDDSAGGQGIDRGDYQQGEAREEHKPSALDEVRAEWQGEEATQQAERAEAEAAERAHEQAYAEAVENYPQLDPAEQYQVNVEWLGRSSEQMAQQVDFGLAQEMNGDLFAGAAVDAQAAAALLGVGCANITATLENAGITSLEQLTPEVMASLNNPVTAQVFAEKFLPTIGVGQMLADGDIDPVTWVGTLMPFVPVLLSGQNPALISQEYKVQYAQALCIAFGEKKLARTVDPESAERTFADHSKWFGRIGANLRYQRQQAEQQPQPSRSAGRSTRSSRQAKPTTSRYRTNTDLFDSEMESLYQARHGGV